LLFNLQRSWRVFCQVVSAVRRTGFAGGESRIVGDTSRRWMLVGDFG
jgi:hypothetical protein